MGTLFGVLNGFLTVAFLVAVLGPRSLQFDPLLLLRELASMLRARVPLPEALGQIAEGHRWRARRRLQEVQRKVEEGEPLSRALSCLPRRWAPEAVLSMVAVGERAGHLPELLDELAAEYERLYALDRRLRSVLIYPLVVLWIACMCWYMLAWKVVPAFETLHQGMGGELPLLARLFSGLWSWAGMPAWVVVTLLFYHLVYTYRRPLRFGRSTVVGRWLAWRLPVVSGLRMALLEIRFARTLRLLLDAGVTFPEALQLCERAVADDRAGDAIVDAARRIREGEPPSKVLRGLPFLSPAFVLFLSESERRGDFLDVTRVMAQAAEDRFVTRMEVLERVLEPAVTLALGVFIGVAVIGIYQAMFNLISPVGIS